MEPRSLPVPGAAGLKLNMLEWSREGVAMVMLHGFGNEAHAWDDFAPSVAPYYRVLALDLRGHGDSDWHPQAAYDYDDHVADLEAVTDHHAIDRMVLIGHSLGGRISLLYGGRHPEKIAGLVIVDSAPELDRRGTARISLDVAQQREPDFGSIADYEQELVHAYPAATPAAIRRMAKYGIRQREDGRWILKMDPAFRGAVGTAASELDARAVEERSQRHREQMWRALEILTCPVLVVRGAASDVLSPDVADRMADEKLERGSLAVVPRAGHSVMIDNPRGFEAAVLPFVLGE